MANNYPEYTEKVPDGGGLFDEIMTTLKKHIDVEYDKQRIRGADYTKVWLGSMEAALANTTQYLLGNALLDVQRRKIEAEILAIEAEREKTELERDKLQFEINELLPLQKQQLQLQVDKLAAEIPLIQAQIDKIYAETDLIHTQDATAKWNLTHLSPLEKIKLDAEGKLINQRYKSEIAQISTIVDGKPISGAIGKQIELHEQQRISFIRDTEHKLAKLMTDAWAVDKTVDEGIDAPLALGNRDISRVVQKTILEGMGIQLDITDKNESEG